MAPAIVIATVNAVLLSVISTVLAQVIQAYRTAQPLVLDLGPIIHFVIWTLVNVPPNFLWQQFLEDSFPGYTVAPTVVEGKGKSSELLPEKKLNARNTLVKLVLDQTVGAPINTALFIAGMSALQGADSQTILQTVKRDCPHLLVTGYKLWPLVSVLSFTLIPVQQRVVFGSLIGVGWNVFLSIFASL